MSEVAACLTGCWCCAGSDSAAAVAVVPSAVAEVAAQLVRSAAPKKSKILSLQGSDYVITPWTFIHT